MERLVFPFASNLKSHRWIKNVGVRELMAQEDNKLELANFVQMEWHFRSDRLQRKKRSSNLRAPFTFQPSEMQIGAK